MEKNGIKRKGAGEVRRREKMERECREGEARLGDGENEISPY